VVFETVCTDLESEGYEVQPFIIPAAGVGAPHRRERVWIIATNTESERTGQNDERLWQRSSRISGGEGTSRSEDVADPNESRSGEGRVSRDISNEGRRAGETRGESIQSEDRQTRTDNIGSSSANVGNTQHNGSSTSEIGRRNEEINGGTEKRQNKSFESEGTSGREDNENMANSRRTLQSRTELGAADEDEVGEGYANQSQRSSSTSESNVANAERERLEGLNQQSTTISGKDERTYTRNESSRDQATGTEDVADTYARLSNGTYEEVQSRGQTSDTSSTRGGENVADSESFSSDVGGRGEYQEERDGQRKIRGEGSEDVANSERIGQQGSREHVRPIDTEENKVRQTSRFNDGSQGEEGWWLVEPNVGRVAHGVSGRVHRLKGLGNSIVPQIAEEIGRAIIKAEKE
jgi:site-specific DNA-cytosine methylase